jgi:predicted ATPase
MLTQITISGYKSLHGSTTKLSHFTAIVGRNNVGKSNLFDGLRLLSHLAQMPVASAFKPERHRGDPIDSFFSAPRLSFVCDFDLSHTPHPFEPSLSLTHAELHYELEIVFRQGVLSVESEKLWGNNPHTKETKDFIKASQKYKNRVTLHRDTTNLGRKRHYSFPSARSLLAMVDDAELYPHVVALARSLRSWRFFHFEPNALRDPSPAMNILELESNGRGLSGFYDTLANRNPARFKSVERALRRGIPEAAGIRLLTTGDHRRLLALVRHDGREFVARVLSDGTLRFLALLALAYAPQPPDLVCFEEPENGVHPGRLPFMVDTLRGLSERGSEGGRRSQVIVNSHSPYLVDLLEPEEMLVAYLKKGGVTAFASVGEELFASRPFLKAILESGQQTLGELWSEGSLHADA